MKYDLVIFDLDGTLLDTLDDLTQAVNYALDAQGFPRRSREEVRRLIGNGIASTMRRAVPEGAGDEAYERALADFKSYYLSHVNVYTRPFDGIPAVTASVLTRDMVSEIIASSIYSIASSRRLF